MKFSLLVVTTDRLYLVKRLFYSLVVQTCRDFEVVLVHGEACTERAQALAQKFAGQLAISHIIASPTRSLSKARNLALPLLAGEYVAFPDDDCVYEPETLANVLNLFCYHPEIDMLLSGTTDLDDCKGVAAKSKIHRLNQYSLFGYSYSFVQFYKKACVDAVGVFDEQIGVGAETPWGSGEDTDYVLRAFQAGFTVWHAPTVCVRHPVVNFSNPGLYAKADAYAGGRMYLLRKHAMPLWFRLCNVVYPLTALLREVPNLSKRLLGYRWRMFVSRLVNF